MAHEVLTGDKTQRLLEQAAGEVDPGSDDASMVRVMRRELEIATKLSSKLVEEKSRVSSDAYEAWRTAKATSNFSLLAPYLEKLFDIARQTAELRGYTNHIYDPLIDLFEEGATYASARAMFEAIKGPIRELVEIQKESQNDDTFLRKSWDQDKLVAFAKATAGEVGFDFEKGRLDPTTNAFCMNCSCSDVRMTALMPPTMSAASFSAPSTKWAMDSMSRDRPRNGTEAHSAVESRSAFMRASPALGRTSWAGRMPFGSTSTRRFRKLCPN
jgi:carboxypeptidase Taq